MRNRKTLGLIKSLTNLWAPSPTVSSGTRSGVPSSHFCSSAFHARVAFASQSLRLTPGGSLPSTFGHARRSMLLNGASIAPSIQLCRCFSSSSKDPQAGSQVDESNALRFAKYLVFCMLIAAGLKVLPALGQNSVEHALMLTESKEVFWRKAGVDRIKLAAKSDAAAQRLIDQGAAQRLVNIIEDSSDSELTTAALQAIEELSRLHTAREAFVLAGVNEALANAALKDSQNQQLANELLVSFTVQRDHVD